MTDVTVSRTIDLLRFPLIVAVVFIHTNLTDVTVGGDLVVPTGCFKLHDFIRNMLSEGFARIAVPLFFFISGFLYFNKADFSLRVYKNKLQKRIGSLLVPYLVWNIVVLFCFFLLQSYFPSFTSGGKKLIVDYNCHDWLNSLVLSPINFQFWFIRDLMIIVICSPIVYWGIRCLKRGGACCVMSIMVVVCLWRV